jgi:hypothetical protein
MSANDDGVLTISCDECAMQHTHACTDCVVTYLLGDPVPVAVSGPVVLDLEQARVLRLFGDAGMVPDLKYDVAG